MRGIKIITKQNVFSERFVFHSHIDITRWTYCRIISYKSNSLSNTIWQNIYLFAIHIYIDHLRTDFLLCFRSDKVLSKLINLWTNRMVFARLDSENDVRKRIKFKKTRPSSSVRHAVYFGSRAGSDRSWIPN